MAVDRFSFCRLMTAEFSQAFVEMKDVSAILRANLPAFAIHTWDFLSHGSLKDHACVIARPLTWLR